MDYIKSQMDLDSLLKAIERSDCFLREVYYDSYTYLTNESIVAPSSLGDLHLIILGEDDNFFGVHLIFERVSEYGVSLQYDLDIKGSYSDSSIELYLNGTIGLVKAKALRYKLFESEVFGKESIVFNYLASA